MSELAHKKPNSSSWYFAWMSHYSLCSLVVEIFIHARLEKEAFRKILLAMAWAWVSPAVSKQTFGNLNQIPLFMPHIVETNLMRKESWFSTPSSTQTSKYFPMGWKWQCGLHKTVVEYVASPFSTSLKVWVNLSGDWRTTTYWWLSSFHGNTS